MSSSSSATNTGTGYPCEKHKSWKKGVCPACKSCKLCPHPEGCPNISMHHVPQKQGRKKRKVNSEAKMANIPIIPAPKYSVAPTPITFQSLFQPATNRIAQFCTTLNIDYEASDIPIEGFKPSVIRNPSRSQRRAKRALTIISQAIAMLLCPEEPQLVLQMLRDNGTSDSSNANELKCKLSQETLEANLLEYSLNPHASIADVAQSLLAGSYDRTSCNDMLIQAAQRKCGLTEEEIEWCEEKDDLHFELDSSPHIADYERLLKSKAKMGKMKFASLRNAFKQIKDDNEFPAASYRCRLDSVKLQHAMEFLQSNLDIRPGRVRNVRMGSAIFENVPIYERGGLSLKRMYEKYSSMVETNSRVGINTFYGIVKVLTKKGETKCEVNSEMLMNCDELQIDDHNT